MGHPRFSRVLYEALELDLLGVTDVVGSVTLAVNGKTTKSSNSIPPVLAEVPFVSIRSNSLPEYELPLDCGRVTSHDVHCQLVYVGLAQEHIQLELLTDSSSTGLH